MKLTALFAAAGRALMAGAEHFEQSTGGQTVVADAKKTLSDAASAALGLVRSGATQPAIDALSPALAKIGIPAELAGPFATFSVGQGEDFVGRFIAKL